MGSAGMEFQLLTQDISRTRVDGAWFYPRLPGIFYQCFFGGPNASSLVGSLGICCLPRHFMKLIGHFISIFPPVSVESKFQNLNGYWVVSKASRTRTSNDFFWTNHSKIRIKCFIKWSGGWGLDTHALDSVSLSWEERCKIYPPLPSWIMIISPHLLVLIYSFLPVDIKHKKHVCSNLQIKSCNYQNKIAIFNTTIIHPYLTPRTHILLRVEEVHGCFGGKGP